MAVESPWREILEVPKHSQNFKARTAELGIVTQGLTWSEWEDCKNSSPVEAKAKFKWLQSEISSTDNPVAVAR